MEWPYDPAAQWAITAIERSVRSSSDERVLGLLRKQHATLCDLADDIDLLETALKALEGLSPEAFNTSRTWILEVEGAKVQLKTSIEELRRG